MYFWKYKMGPLGMEEYVGHEVTGWRVYYRATSDAKFSPPLQRFVYDGSSRFGALRALVAKCRLWCGKVFFLDIEKVEPIVRAHYELIEA